MKARDLTPACIGRQIRVEDDGLRVEGKLGFIKADDHGITIRIGGHALALTGTEEVSITG